MRRRLPEKLLEVAGARYRCLTRFNKRDEECAARKEPDDQMQPDLFGAKRVPACRPDTDKARAVKAIPVSPA